VVYVISCRLISFEFRVYQATYDETGAVDFLDVFNASVDAYVNLTVAAGP
jgi:hypothetical protein